MRGRYSTTRICQTPPSVLTEDMHGELGVQGIPSTRIFLYFGILCEMPKIILRNFAEGRVIVQNVAEFHDFSCTEFRMSPKGTHTKSPVVQTCPGASQAPVV
jgi:hypothetical protein